MTVASTGTADLDVPSVSEIAETLRRLLADVFALYLKTKPRPGNLWVTDGLSAEVD